MLRGVFKDYRFYFLVIAFGAMVLMFVFPKRLENKPIYHLTFIVDITRSMNATDYEQNEKTVSRLEFVKLSLRKLLAQLPCQSSVSLGIFTERRSTLLFEPIEVCAGFSEIDSTLNSLDWRMAWAADSRISQALKQTIESVKNSNSTLVFFTDGQEAPPINPRYAPDLAALKDKTKGMIVGVGGLQAVPIPKFNERGEKIGFYSADDVPHRSTFGESNLNPEAIEGFDARNAPFGKNAVSGSEHLSALQEGYLQQLGQTVGFHYTRLIDDEQLKQALDEAQLTTIKAVQTDQRWKFATMALIFLTLTYSFFNLQVMVNLSSKFNSNRKNT
jgi:mxaL protein